jgi:hypothetical protein
VHGEPGEILDQKAEFVLKRAKLRDAPGINTKQIADLEQPLKIACLIKKVATAALANVVAAAGARAAAERSAYKELQRKIAIFNRLSSLRTLNIHEREYPSYVKYSVVSISLPEKRGNRSQVRIRATARVTAAGPMVNSTSCSSAVRCAAARALPMLVCRVLTHTLSGCATHCM